MTELKPCPFCGGEAEFFEDVWSDNEICYVQCVDCRASTNVCDTQDEAVVKWNTRPNPWHTGTPTEDGTFLVLWKDTEEQMRRFSVLHWNEYNDTWYDEETTYCNWGDEDHAEVIAWQKIEPYKEEKQLWI